MRAVSPNEVKAPRWCEEGNEGEPGVRSIKYRSEQG